MDARTESRQTPLMPTYRVQGPHDAKPYLIEAGGFEYNEQRDAYLIEDITVFKGEPYKDDSMPLRLICPPVEL
jgi:hypothetical protein